MNYFSSLIKCLQHSMGNEVQCPPTPKISEFLSSDCNNRMIVQGNMASHTMNWSRILAGDEDAELKLPPLLLSKENSIMVSLQLRRRGSSLAVFGGFHEDFVPLNTQPTQARLKVQLTLLTRGGRIRMCLGKELIVTLRHGNNGWVQLMSISKIPWNKLATSEAPQTEVCITPTDEETFHHAGLSPILPDICHRYAEYDYDSWDWSTLEAARNYLCEWHLMAQHNDESARLHFPPLVIAQELLNTKQTAVAVIFAYREGNDLNLHGGFVDHQVEISSPPTVKLSLSLEFVKSNNVTMSLKKDIIWKMERETSVGWPRIFTIRNFPWNEMAPRAEVAMAPLRGELEKFNFHTLKPLEAQRNGMITVDWNDLEGARNYAREFTGMIEQLNDDKMSLNQLHFPPILLSDVSLSNHVIVAIFFLVREANELTLYGGYHENMSRVIVPMRVGITLTLDLSSRMIAYIDAVVQLNHRIRTGWFKLASMPVAWNSWQEARCRDAPRGKLSVIKM